MWYRGHVLQGGVCGKAEACGVKGVCMVKGAFVA